MAANLVHASAGAADFQATVVAAVAVAMDRARGRARFAGYFFHDSIQSTLDIWLTSPEYNYGPLVPLLAALMLWRDLSRSEVGARDRSGGWLGVAIAVLGLLFGLIEVLSQTRFPGQLGLFLTIVGLVVAWLGERRRPRCGRR